MTLQKFFLAICVATWTGAHGTVAPSSCQSLQSGVNMGWSTNDPLQAITSAVIVNPAILSVTFTMEAALLKDATYVIDVTSYEAAINNATNCENRNATVFSAANFSDYWVLSYDIGAATNFMYPSTDKWSTTTNTSVCDTVQYSATFKWSELRNCKTKSGTKDTSIAVTSISDGANSRIELSGKFFVSIVAPWSTASETGMYRVKTANELPFRMGVFQSATTVLSSVSVQNFKFSAFIVGIVPRAGNIQITLFTEANRLFKMSAMTILNNPTAVNGYTMNVVERNPAEASFCFSSGSSSCLQSFTLSIEERSAICPEYFNGTYSIDFNISCRTPSTECPQVLNSLPTGTSISLGIETDYRQIGCTTTGNVTSIEPTLSVASPDIPKSVGSTVEINADMTLPAEFAALIASVDVYNVWLCVQPVGVLLSAPQADGTGGCLDTNALARTQLIVSGASTTIGTANSLVTNNTAKSSVSFSFSMMRLSNASNYTVVVHAQLRVNFNPNARRRRRMLLQVLGGVPPFTYGLATLAVVSKPVVSPPASSNASSDSARVWIIMCAVLSLLVIILLVGGLIHRYGCRRCWATQEEKKDVDDLVEVLSPKKGIQDEEVVDVQ